LVEPVEVPAKALGWCVLGVGEGSMFKLHG
jgi:hypothetical protein